jgi:rhamnose utilization protein RhaD (predicted bifunctional aldolase and dehydrogenase)
MAEAHTDASELSPVLAQLVARSRRLGADRSVCNWGGGNTSAKAEERDHRGRVVRVLWVKGSGSDLATVTAQSFTGLYLDEILPLMERERMSDAEMVAYLARCFYEPGRPRPSIETLLHAFLPFRHIDHTHADATNFFACAANGEQLARDCFGDELVWIPYMRPGFALARRVALAVQAQPGARLVILAKHGLITWGNSDEECYAHTLWTIERAQAFVARRLQEPAFGGWRTSVLPPLQRQAVAAAVMPSLRGLVAVHQPCVLRFEDTSDVLEFSSSRDAERLVKVGAACPDHLIHTKPWPLLVNWVPGSGTEADMSTGQGLPQLKEALRLGIEAYSARYQQYLADNAG